MQPILQNAIQTLLVDSRQALTIWAGLIAVAVGAFMLLSVVGRRTWYDPPRIDPERLALLRAEAVVRADELRRCAEEIAVAAGRAGAAAERRRSEWLAAQTAVETAWQRYDSTDTAARRAVAATAIPVPRRQLTPAEVALRERYMHRSATEAYYRGDLAIEQLLDALSSRNGWNPCLHPADQEAVMLRIARGRRHRAFHTARAAELGAWRDAEFADAARISLDNEALAAAADADRAQRRVVALTPRSRLAGLSARWSHWTVRVRPRRFRRTGMA